MRVRSSLVVLLGALLPSAAQGAEADLALITIKPAHGVEAPLAKILGEALAVSLRNHGAFQTVLGPGDVVAMLDMDQQKAALGCDETGCMGAIGNAIGVPYGGFATIGKLGSRFLITLKVIDVGTTTVVASAMIQGENEEDLVEKVEDLVAKTASQFMGHRRAAAKAAEASAPAVTKASSGGFGPRVGGAIAATGLLISGAGIMVRNGAQSDFDREDGAASVTQNDLDVLHRKFALGKGMFWGGLAVTGIGVWRIVQ